MKPGSGNVVINHKPLNEYFPSEILQIIVRQPLVTIEAGEKWDFVVNVSGGGYTGQAEAIRHGISRALVEDDAEVKPALRKEGFITRDARMVERKKPGRRKARRKFQFSKR
jgi:small subunit ribosomal protein S9